MEKEYVLKAGGLYVTFYKDQPKDPITDVKMLYKWLRTNTSTNVEKFDHLYYTINDNEFHFKLLRVDRNTWNVHQLELPDKVFFTFKNFEGLKLIDDFEQAIIEKLKSIHYE